MAKVGKRHQIYQQLYLKEVKMSLEEQEKKKEAKKKAEEEKETEQDEKK